MATELIKKDVDGTSYEFQQFGASQALKMGTRLVKIVGEPLAIALGSTPTGDKKKFLDKELAPDLLGKAVRALVERLDENEVLSIIQELTANKVLCNGQKIIFDTHYEGKIGHLFKVLAAALEVQYGNFFEGGFAQAMSSNSPIQFPSIQAR